ncbi:heme-binding protein [Thalassobaculum sp. OXR-137]|uniref:GlcG/HbpS family heme-binding protein n=1 Tax=Thalassobaculum sp. OXR-137 TaxID=3100173 RepID=UPI002AC9054E|nr:heme-binding protein [Thalassobaculum sp. OXR-137]WPZ32182.1 heme-binding protein [Thalassobaculum sp. OXR-137]
MPIPTSELSLDEARAIIAGAFAKAAELGLKPLAVAVLDAGGHIRAIERQDGASMHRPEIAIGKAYGALAMGFGSRELANRVKDKGAVFLDAVNGMIGGRLIPAPGGVLVKDKAGNVIAAVGISGDTSDRDEACAVAGIAAAGLDSATG